MVKRKGSSTSSSTKKFKIDSELLIAEVFLKSVLWLESSKNYKNTSVTDKLWTEIGAKFDIPGEVAKAKFKNLKDRYRKEKKKVKPIRSGHAGSTEPDSSWQFYNSLGFLNDNEIDSPTADNLSQILDSASDDEVGNDNEDIESDDSTCNDYSRNAAIGTTPHTVSPNIAVNTCPEVTNVPPSNTQTPTGNTPSEVTNVPPTNTQTRTAHPFPSKKKKLTSNEKYKQRALKVEEAKLEFIQGMKEQQHQKKEPDADEKFILSLLPFMKELSSIQKLTLRNALQAAVTEALVQKELDNAAVVAYYDPGTVRTEGDE